PVEAREHLLLDLLPGLAQLLPVGQLGDDARPLVADRLGRVAQVRPQLRIRQLDPGRLREARRRHRDARISATCSVRTLEPRRESPPPICSRHEPSSAVQTAAPDASTASHLSASIALDVSAFLIANVPPKPQHSRAWSSSTSSRPRTLRSRRSGASPTRVTRSEWHVGWYATRARNEAPTSSTPSCSTSSSDSS